MKKKLPKCVQAECKKCGKKFSYKPKHNYYIRTTCSEHRPTLSF